MAVQDPRDRGLAYACCCSNVALSELTVAHEVLKPLSEPHDKWILMHNTNASTLPTAFCWTRFGPEAGESFSDILARKDAERQAGDGVFYWGIGSAVGRALEALIACVDEPEVLFSPIASAPRHVDVSPEHVVRWSAGEGLSGESMLLPEHACVTSRWDPERPDAARYALVCASDEPLRLDDLGDLCFGSLRNFRSGAPIGASQATAVVSRDPARPDCGRAYRVTFRASLVRPYLLRLSSPELIDRSDGATQQALSLAL
jgi:hypothetical protein